MGKPLTVTVVGVTSTRYNPAVYGEHRGAADAIGVKGKAVNGTGVAGESTTWFGTYGKSAQQSGVYGETAVAHSSGPAGVYGKSTGDGGIGVTGEATLGNSWGVYGLSATGAVRLVGDAEVTATGMLFAFKYLEDALMEERRRQLLELWRRAD